MLKIYNTLTGKKEPFEPIDAEDGEDVCLRRDGL